MVQPSYVDLNYLYAASGSATQSLVIPSTVQKDDLCFLFVGIDNGVAPTWTPPAGWNVLFAPQSATNMAFAGFWKRMSATEINPATITVTCSTSYSNIIGFWYRDASDPVVIGTVGNRGGVSGASVTAPSLTTTAANQKVLTFAGDRSTATTAAEQGPPTFSASTFRGGSEGLATLSAATGICSTFLGDRIIATAGASGADTATYPDTSTNAWAAQVAINGQQTQAMRVYDGAGTSARLYYTIDSTGGAGSVKPVLGLSKT